MWTEGIDLEEEASSKRNSWESYSSIIVSLAFALFYTLCITFAVIAGSTIGFIPADYEVFNSAIPFLFRVLNLSYAIFIIFLPFFFVANLNTIAMRIVSKKKGHSLQRQILRVIVGILLAFPMIYIAVSLYFLLGFLVSAAFGWPEVVIVQSGIAAGFLVLYTYAISVVMDRNPKQYFKEQVTKAQNWMFIVLFTAILAVPSLMLINPLQKGYFRYFLSFEHFLSFLPDLIMRSFIIGIILALIHQYAFSYVIRHVPQKRWQDRMEPIIQI